MTGPFGSSSSPGSGAVAISPLAAARLARTLAFVDPPFVQPAHLVVDLVEREVERGLEFGGRRSALHQVMVDVHEDLARVRVAGLARLVLREVDVDAAYVTREFRDSFEFLVGQRFERRIDVCVLPEDDDIHARSVYVRSRRGSPGPGVRAIVAAKTSAAPAARKARAAAPSVPPVVATSSTTRIRLRPDGARPRARGDLVGAPASRARLGRAGQSFERTEDGPSHFACDRAGQDLGVIDAVSAHARIARRRPGDDVDRSGCAPDRVRQVRNDGA